jgi:hypothetical protein
MAKAKAKAKKKTATFTKEERAAMKDYVREKKGGGEGEGEVLAKIKKMAKPDRELAERLHAIIKANAPSLTPRTWYGMPAYANADGVVCFFQDAGKFKARYATLGFSDKAKLDDGVMWPSSFAVKDLDEARIVALLKKAVG